MPRTTGRVTMPIQEGIDDAIRQLAEALGADAVRNSDGTWLPAIASELVDTVYSTYFPARGDQEWALANPDTLVNQYLMSQPHTAMSDTPLVIDVLDGYFREQFAIHPERHERFWEVINRTTGEIVPTSGWSLNASNGLVTIDSPTPFHEYTVSFLADQLWDSTQMYNYITNNWYTDPTRVKERPYDVRKNKVWEHTKEALAQWLTKHPEVDVVRFTTFFYHFTLVFNEQGKEKFVDWFGYSASVSPEAIDSFEQETGIALRAEDFVDGGYYNSPFRVPSDNFRRWIDFQSRFVAEKARGLVEITHQAGRRSVMFLGDNWIGTEPYGPYFASIGLDGVVGSAGSAATTRLIADIDGVDFTEVRFLPYFFPDVFNHEGGDPVGQANDSWLTSRRAIVRHPIDRMGYGGYVSLALEFPEFIERITDICQEFRDIHELTNSEDPANASFTVGIINSWGKIRSWQTHMVAHALWYKACYSYVGVLESLAGLPFKVKFLSFDDVINNGIDEDINVLINAGSAGTAYSGAHAWDDERLTTAIRQFVAEGGGFIGVGEPTATSTSIDQGRFFALRDVLGVDRELHLSLSTDRYVSVHPAHPIMTDVVNWGGNQFDDGEGAGGDVVAVGKNVQVLSYANGTVQVAANSYGKGRAVYFSGLPYSFVNSRTLQRAIMWAAGKPADSEGSDSLPWWSSHPATEVAWYPNVGRILVTNNSMETITTTVSGRGQSWDLEMPPMTIEWITPEN
ncbi:1,3-beta-galactosyl-N-acetylhexosamine phosphorylase [Actinomyces vulturis]|uniref:1,3-beta-galactosyl-N-acetylhexosamine phosphorylase n=1 Tax=Actinomyces vulturis TaxID=1857645 RepID=UPI0009F36498|nr:1,3-beta-galactosyl-N-acetylhexosamine phosphorylase [Actinomyces vulturis]